MNIFKKTIYNWVDMSYALRFAILMIFIGVFLLCTYYLINILQLDNDKDYIKIAASGVFAVGGGCLTVLHSHEEKSRELALSYVTEKRVKWIDDTRQLTANLFQYVWHYINVDDAKSKVRVYAKASATMGDLYLRYNFNGQRDKILLCLIEKLFQLLRDYKQQSNRGDISTEEIYNTRKDIERCLMLLAIHSQIYFKLEWERVKDETLYVGNTQTRRRTIKKKMVAKRFKLYKKRASQDRYYKGDLDNLDITAIYNMLKNKSETLN